MSAVHIAACWVRLKSLSTCRVQVRPSESDIDIACVPSPWQAPIATSRAPSGGLKLAVVTVLELGMLEPLAGTGPGLEASTERPDNDNISHSTKAEFAPDPTCVSPRVTGVPPVVVPEDNKVAISRPKEVLAASDRMVVLESNGADGYEIRIH